MKNLEEKLYALAIIVGVSVITLYLTGGCLKLILMIIN